MSTTDAPILVHYLGPEAFPSVGGPLSDPALGQLLRGGYRVVGQLPVTDPGGQVAQRLAVLLVQQALTTAAPATTPPPLPAAPPVWTPLRAGIVGASLTALVGALLAVVLVA
jgi:hypothetical protein